MWEPNLGDNDVIRQAANHLPSVLVEWEILDVQLWQWIGLLVLIASAAALSYLAASATSKLIRPLIRRSRISLDDRIVDGAGAPVRLVLAVAFFAAGRQLLGLSEPVEVFFAGLERAFTITGVAWLLARVTDAVTAGMEETLVARGQAAAVSAVPIGRRSVKAVLGALAVLAVLQNFGVNVTGLLAGLGIGGLAFALAAQKTVENLFGGMTLIADQPVRVGDFCRFGERVGTVEEIGLRSTRVRTLDRTVVTVPNAQFASLQLENFNARDRIWFCTTIGVRYETTPDQLRFLLVELKKLLISHPRIHPDPARVRFVGFGAHSLDIEIFAYVLTADINEFHAIREDVLLRIMETVAAAGTGFAFPSQTIYTAADTGIDAERGEKAASSVAEWRQAGSLDLPHPTAARLDALKHTLDYPPRGSSTGT